jgi:hypothetical protein
VEHPGWTRHHLAIQVDSSPRAVGKVITDKTTTPADRARYLRSLDFIKGAEKEAALVDLITSGIN